MINSQSDGRVIDSKMSSRNQIVIPAKIRKALSLKAGDKLMWSVINVNNRLKVLAEPKPKNWAEYSLGLGKEIWKGVDVDKYIKDLRDEWK